MNAGEQLDQKVGIGPILDAHSTIGERVQVHRGASSLEASRVETKRSFGRMRDGRVRSPSANACPSARAAVSARLWPSRTMSHSAHSSVSSAIPTISGPVSSEPGHPARTRSSEAKVRGLGQEQPSGGVTIGKRSIVAAGAVVTSDVPDDVLVAGLAAQLIRRIEIGDTRVFSSSSRHHGSTCRAVLRGLRRRLRSDQHPPGAGSVLAEPERR